MADVDYLALTRSRDGRLELIATMIEDRRPASVWHTSLTSAAVEWQGWNALGYPPGGADPLEWPAVAENIDGRLEVVTMARGKVWHAWQSHPGRDWTGWQSLGKPPEVEAAGSALRYAALAQNRDGRLEVFAADSSVDAKVWHRWQQASGGWADWSPFERPDGRIESFSVGANADGRLLVVAVVAPDGLWKREQDASGAWSSWSPFGGTPPGPIWYPTLALDAEGRLELLFCGSLDAGLYRVHQTTANGSEWESSTLPPHHSQS